MGAAINGVHPHDLDALLEAAKGNVPGSNILAIPGWHPANVSTTVLDDISGFTTTPVIPRPAGAALEVVSSSAQDGVGGSGVRNVKIVYLNASGTQLTKSVVMNGLTAVPVTGTDLYDIQWMHAISPIGSGGVADGIIRLRGAGGGTTYERISAQGNQSLTCRYTVPAGHSAIIHSPRGWELLMRLSAASQTQRMRDNLHHIQTAARTYGLDALGLSCDTGLSALRSRHGAWQPDALTYPFRSPNHLYGPRHVFGILPDCHVQLSR